MSEPLDRIERQLTAAVRGRARRRRRVRLLAPASTLLALVLASAASAVTGVGPMGDLLAEGEPADLAPTRGAAQIRVDQRGPGGEVFAMRAYETPRGVLCFQAPPPSPSGVTAMNCAPPEALASELARVGFSANLATGEDGKTPVIFGVVPGNATAVTLDDPSRAGQPAELSPPWTTIPSRDATAGSADDSLPLRAFLLTVDGRYPSAERPVTLRVTLEGGDELSSEWPVASQTP